MHRTAKTLEQPMKKCIRCLVAIIALPIIFSCKSNSYTTELRANFTKKEIADLKKITEFFKKEICEQRDADFKTCYEQIPHESLMAAGNPFWLRIDFKKQKELYKQISPSTFNKIWSFGKTTYPDSEVVYKSIGAVYNGAYQKFLNDIGKTNESINKYAIKIAETGDVNFLYLNYGIILRHKKEFNLENPHIQLILAIHYLSLNDEAKRKEKWEAE